MIFENELKIAGFTLNNNQLRYKYSDFEELRATVKEHTVNPKDPNSPKMLELRDFRIANPTEEGICHMLIAYPLYIKDMNNLFTLLKLLHYPIP